MKEKLAYIKFANLKQLLTYPSTFKKPIIVLTGFSVVSSVLSVASAYIIKLLIDRATQSDTGGFVPVLLATVAIILFEIVISNLLEYYKSIQFTKELAKLQKRIMASFMEKTWLSLNVYKTGDLLTYINNDAKLIITFWLSIFPSTLALMIHFALAFTLLMQFDTLLALVSFVIAPVFLIFSYPISRKLKALQKDVQSAESNLQSHITESLQNINLIKIFKHEEKSLTQIGKQQSQLIEATKRKSLFSLLNSTVLYIGYYIGYFLGLVFGAYKLSTGSISFGTFSALLNLIGQVQGPMDSLGRSIPQYIISLASSERLADINNLPVETTSEPDVNLTDFQSIVFSNLSFGYTEEHPILRNFNLTLNKGTKLAVVGPSGCGKTTLSRLLLSFVAPDSGNLFIKDQDHQIANISPNTRNLFAYVPQDNVLFSGSISDNLRLANQEASDAALQKALGIACADHFIAELPDGINTIVGERGIGLSEGQIQRICIARAILYNKPILILDEATSALDEDTEQKIVNNLKTAYEDLTIIAITHRPSIKNICNQIVSLEV